jgi:hypothetical protein
MYAGIFGTCQMAKIVRTTITLDADIWNKIRDYRFDSRIDSMSETITELLKEALIIKESGNRQKDLFRPSCTCGCLAK